MIIGTGTGKMIVEIEEEETGVTIVGMEEVGRGLIPAQEPHQGRENGTNCGGMVGIAMTIDTLGIGIIRGTLTQRRISIGGRSTIGVKRPDSPMHMTAGTITGDVIGTTEDILAVIDRLRLIGLSISGDGMTLHLPLGGNTSLHPIAMVALLTEIREIETPRERLHGPDVDHLHLGDSPLGHLHLPLDLPEPALEPALSLLPYLLAHLHPSPVPLHLRNPTAPQAYPPNWPLCKEALYPMSNLFFLSMRRLLRQRKNGSRRLNGALGRVSVYRMGSIRRLCQRSGM